MVSSSTPQTTAQQQALAVVSQWAVEGRPLDATAMTTTTGTWDSSSNVFTATNTNPTALKVDLTYTYTPGNGAVPLFINAVASSLRPSIHASAIVKASSTQSTFGPPAAGNLWLAGMPDGTLNQNLRPDNSVVWDYAGNPVQPRRESA